MLWQKSWLETRWRFFIGLGLLTCAAGVAVFTYPTMKALMPFASSIEASGELGRRIREAVDVQRTYAGFIWYQWFGQTPSSLGTLFAVLLGAGGVAAHGVRSGALFTLTLPVSRGRLVATRAACGLSEWLVIALVPSLLIPVLSPAVGETYSVVDALVHGLCLFVGGAVFFSLALLLSTVFDDVWRPLLIAVALAVAAGLGEGVRGGSRFGIFALMNGETYFRTGHLPLIGLALGAAASAAMLYGASVTFSRRDF
jgi:hypothetical protein